MPRLPLEIVFLIVEAIRPANPDALLSPQHETTLTLLSLTRVSKALYRLATQILRQHCAYLDTRERAQAFSRCLQFSPPPFVKQQDAVDPGWKGIKSLFVACFPDGDGFIPSEEAISPELDARAMGLENVVEPLLAEVLSSSPVSDVSSVSPTSSPLNDLATAMALYDIFHAIAPTLRRLVVDMPFRTLWPEDDYKCIKKVLWRGFEALVNLEEFTSVRDELFLYPHIQQDWRFEAWPNLRRLSLYNLDLSHAISAGGFRYTFEEMEHLEHIICSRADGLSEGVELLRDTYGDTVSVQGGNPSTGSRKLKLVHVDVEGVDPIPWFEKRSLRRLQLFNKEVEALAGPAFEVHPSTWPLSPAEIVQGWILRKSLEGTLWEQSTAV